MRSEGIQRSQTKDNDGNWADLYFYGMLEEEWLKTKHHKSLEERAAEFDGQLMLDGESEWGEPVGKEKW